MDEDYESVNSIVDVLRELKENTIANLELFQRAVPERTYVHAGETAWDCEQLTFSVIQGYVGPPGDQAAGPQPCDGPYSVVVQVQLVRCVPSFNARAASAPSAEAMENHAFEMLRDQWALLRSVKSLDSYQSVIADTSITTPQGSFQAIVLNLVLMV